MKIASLKPIQWFPGQKVSVKPHLRGWIHLVAAPLSLAASIVLTCLAPTGNLPCGLVDSLWNLCALPPLLLVPTLGSRVEPP